ncbi:DUF1150 family protein [Hyphomonas sp.]|jgi:hypothetical protein|uniref:DUF1150 family protein n=1 Tax=Hyphomonas sp. TaxID=87 RepID=UPI001D8866FA|nr:DUF1150 family protein [Hyphomonas sp.]MBU3920331.1 DUF1150 domain-containing protein [Alphaproteobacteria bacterium]MBU4061033.1 DUF1150 domain-containing protein [Alphaproteobacteria bacterium]MBU4165889.1 DUF1150 domain-containing protein [Alphaproteobacteria bacterium]
MTTGLKSTAFEGNSLVYIRHLDDGEIRSLLPPDALDDVSDPEDLFVVASADGQRLAIVEGREAAFAAALANDLRPHSVH